MGFGDTVKQIQANWGFDVGATDGVDKRSSLIQPRPLSAESLTRPLNHDELLEAYIIHPWSYKAANLIAHKLASVPMVLLRARSQGTSGEQRNKAAARAKRHIRQLKGNTEQGIAYSIAKRHDVKMRTGVSIEDIAKAHRLEVVDDHPLLDLLGNVNEEHNFKTLKESISSYLTLHGNSYVHKVRGDGLNQPPTELWSIAPNRVRIVPGTESDDPFVLGYLVDTGVERKRSVRREDMIHWGFFHPKNDYYGFSPLHSVRDEILADLAAAGYNKAFFENDAEPRGLLTSDQVLDKATADDLRARWEESHRGYENAHRIAVLGLGTTYKQVGLSHRDMHFLELRNFAKSAILGSLGVPPILVGDLGESCLPADTRIYTPSGPKRIADVRAGDRVWALDERTGNYQVHDVNGQWCAGEKQLYRIKTARRTVQASDNHPLLKVKTMRKPMPGYPNRTKLDWELEWTPLRDLEPGDIITSAKHLLPDHPLDDDTAGLAELAGAFAGDGHLGIDGRYADKRIGHVGLSLPDSGRNQEVRARYADLLRSLFGERVWHRQHKADVVRVDDQGIRIHGQPARWLVDQIGVDVLHASAKAVTNGDEQDRQVPAWIWRQGKQAALRFLRGYLDTDGHVSVGDTDLGKASYNSTSSHLIESVRALAIAAGLRASNVTTQRPSKWANGPVYRFGIGIPEDVARIGSANPTYADRIRQAMDQRDPDRRVAGEGFELSGHTRVDEFGDLGFERIRSIDALGVEPVYDIEVDGSHNFVAEGLAVHNSYANAFIQQRLFVEQTILAYMAKFEEPANDSLLAEYPDSDELVLAFDVTRVRELLEDLSEKLDMANTGIQSGMTLNEVRSDVLERDPVDGGDRVFLGANLVPVADESTEERGKSAPTAQRQADDSLVQAPAENFVPPRDQEERAMEEALNPLWAAVIADIGQRTLDELVEGDDPPPFQQGQRVEQFQADRAGLIPNIEGSTRTRILALVHQAIDEGWTVARLRDEVDALYETMIEERAPSIARTEVISAYNFAALEAARQTTVVDRKRWITTLDGRARAAHLSAHGQVRAKGEPYSVGGEALMFPSDPSGSPAMTINCRCTQMFLRRGQQAPEPGEITEGDRQFYKRFTNEVAGLVGGHTPKVQGFLDEQRQRVLTHIEERAES